MRIAALAFGVVAGLIASLILALGGLDVSLGNVTPDRQIQITRFALFILANIGVFGAGLVLASPVGGAILFVVGAISWVAAALLLHHGPDLVLIVPPALLIIAAVFSIIAVFRQGAGFALPPLRLNRRKAAPEPDEYDEMPPVPVGAGFFGTGGTGQPLRNGNEPSMDGLDGRDRPPVDWSPRKRRPSPPRQQPMFEPSDDEYEESGWSRLARGVSSVLSFGLYAAVAGALLLVFWNARGLDNAHPAAAKLEPASVAEASVPPVPKPAVSSAPAEVDATATLPASPQPADAAPSIPPQLMAGVVVAEDPNSPSFEAPRNILGTALAPPTQTTASTDSGSTDSGSTDSAPADLTSTDSTGDGAGGTTSVIMPFPMPPEIAASRNGPSSRPPAATRTAPARPAADTGL